MPIEISPCDLSELDTFALYFIVSATVDGWPIPDDHLTIEGCENIGEAIGAISRYLDELTCESCSAVLHEITGGDRSRAIAYVTATGYRYL